MRDATTGISTRRPGWFVGVAVLLLLWGVVGVVGWLFDMAMTPASLAAMGEWDRRFYATRPEWLVWLYGIAVWAGLIGSAALILRRRDARPFYIVSLVASILLFGWMFARTDIIAAKGLLVATGFPVLIVIIAAFEVWLAGLARRRGWIG